MVTVIIIAAALLVGVGLVASQLVRMREWLKKPPPDPDDPA